MTTTTSLSDKSLTILYTQSEGCLEVQAPSNIALIKYMGKSDVHHNLPANPSLSYTSEAWHSTLRISPNATDNWQPWSKTDALILSEQAQARYLKHWRFLKEALGIHRHYTLQSTNNFPAHCGLASSASSFAALSAGAALATEKPIDWQHIADLSRQGSGSSCRSFFKPWVVWDHPSVEAIDTPYPSLLHHVIMVDASPKAIGSSEAHRRVQTSPLYPKRLNEVRHRLDALLDSFEHQRWDTSFKIIWDEFISMHALFESARKPFGYLTPKSHQVLNMLKDYWQQHHDGPWVTVDAGANIHLLYRPDQTACAKIIAEHCTNLNLTYLAPHDHK